MDFFEAMQQLKEGKAIRPKKWEEGDFICLQEESVKIAGKQRFKYKVLDQDECECTMLPIQAVLNSDWEIVED